MTDEERADAITMLSLAAPTIRLSGEEMYRFDRAIRTAVMALQERKTGRWKKRLLTTEPFTIYGYDCPFCEFGTATDSFNFCPHCGAKMEGDE